MSLFKLKNLWSTQLTQNQIDQKHLALGKIDNLPAISGGDFKGQLKVFVIKINNKQQMVQLIFQKDLQSPIIDLKFVVHPDQNVRKNTIGVLLFRKFIYLSLQKNSNNQYECQMLHIDVEPSFAIMISPLSVLTLNSSIQLLNPKQITQIKQADPIYPFTVHLNQMYYCDGEQLVKLCGANQQWRIILGRTRSLYSIDDKIIIIGQRQLWEVADAKIIKSKVLEQQVSCGAIAFRPKSEFNILIGNFIRQLLVYTSNYELLWAVKLDNIPIKILVSQALEIKGSLIILNQNGLLQINYAGTQMPQQAIRPITEPVNIARVQNQVAAYMKRNKQESSSGGQKKVVQSIKKQNKHLSIKATFGQPEQSSDFSNNKTLARVNGKLLKCLLNIELFAQQNLTNVLITINHPSNIQLDKEEIQLASIKGKQSATFSCYINKEKFPYATKAKIMVRYQKGNTIQLQTKQIKIPVKFQSSVFNWEGIQKANKKILFKANIDLPSFNQIFPDLIQRGAGQQKKSMCFNLINNVKTAIVYNKNFTKVKIQSQLYLALCFIFIEFVERLSEIADKKSIKLVVQTQVPLEELYDTMREHFNIRLIIKEKIKKLQVATEQFRNAQKKLLIKMKEKNSNLNHIDKLLQFTYEKILKAASQFQETSQQLEIINHSLNIALEFILNLVFYRSSPSPKAKSMAYGIIGYEKQSIDSGWEQKVINNSYCLINKKYQNNFENLQKLIMWVISKVNNGDWNQK